MVPDLCFLASFLVGAVLMGWSLFRLSLNVRERAAIRAVVVRRLGEIRAESGRAD